MEEGLDVAARPFRHHFIPGSFPGRPGCSLLVVWPEGRINKQENQVAEGRVGKGERKLCQMEVNGWRNSSVYFPHPSQNISCCVKVIQHLPVSRKDDRKFLCSGQRGSTLHVEEPFPLCGNVLLWDRDKK